MGGQVILDAMCRNAAGAAVAKNRLPLVRRLTLRNTGEETLEGLAVCAETVPAFAAEWRGELETLGPGETAEFSPEMALSMDALEALERQQQAVLKVSVWQKGAAEPLASLERTVMLFAPDEWEGPQAAPELAAAYVCPGSPAAAGVMGEIGRSLAVFSGYEDHRPDGIRMQAAAVYETIQNRGIFLSPPEPEPGRLGLRVGQAEELLARRQGDALAFSAFYCACLEAAGLHPLLTFAGEEVYAGWWLSREDGWEMPGQTELDALRTAAEEKRLCLLDCTGMAENVGLPFREAVLRPEQLPADGFCFSADIARARAAGILPISGGLPEETGAPAPPEPSARQQVWERSLLDLSLRSMLVNFRMTRSTLQLLAPDCETLEDAASQGIEMQILPRPVDWPESSGREILFQKDLPETLMGMAREEAAFGRLFSCAAEGELPGILTSIYRKARVSLEENGANTLYLALGLLRWYERGSSRARYAPLVLIPVELARKGARMRYVLRVREEEPQVNITLLEMLRQDFGMEADQLAALPRGGCGLNLRAFFRRVEKAVADQAQWGVEEAAFLGLFSFNQFIMWSDLRNRAEDLKRNKVVRSLISGKLEWTPETDFPRPEELDSLFRPSDMAVPITVDASQLAAVCAAGMGKSFVLHGPPGTGKSQTITNMIANALYQGKTVLFIAEKMAALSVVQDRLEKIGLGPFSLELHSNKAKKKEVLGQLQKVLELGKAQPAEDFAHQAERLYKLRRELNAYVEALHRPQPFGFSAWEAFSRCGEYLDAPPDVSFLPSDVEKLSPRQLQVWEDIASEVRTAAEACGGPAGHPLREWTNSSYSPSVRSELGSRIPVFRETLAQTRARLADFCREVGLPADGGPEYLSDLFRLADFCREDHGIPASLVSGGELKPLREELDALCAGGRRRDAAREALFIVYRQGILLYNEPTARKEWEEASADWFLPRLLRQQKIMKALRALAKEPKSLLKEQVPAHLNLLAEYDAGTRVIAGAERTFAPLFGHLWKKREPDWRELESKFDEACRLQELAGRLAPEPEKKQALLEAVGKVCLANFPGWERRMKKTLDELTESSRQMEQERARIWRLCQVELRRPEGGLLAALTECGGRWGENLDRLRDWCSWMAVQRRACEEGLGVLAGACRSGAIAPAEVLPAFYRGLYSACADAALEREPVLASFRGGLFENKMRRFRALAQEFEQLTRQELAARLSAKVPVHSGGIAASSEIGILQRAIRSGGRTMSIRRLFDSIPNLLRLLCPCMLMSPISVAQYIDPQYPPFDLVIFDEASQLPTCEAVGAIARGENVVVVGDPRQLPPTRFFMDARGVGDDPSQEDLESILDDCLAISMPEEHLRWHYRSRHESLIAFSNRNFYGNQLYTFPSPSDRESRVSFVPVEGRYERGGARHNRAEAEAVTEEVLRRLADPALRRQSIGVVTFSAAQQELIEDLLLEAFAAHPELEEPAAAEPLFVKNLENVQGDERDVILFSIGYGPDRSGRIALNFGPLNREGGWRRLNVAVSRARQEMKVYSSLRPEQIDLSRTHSEGVAALRAFLEFAQSGAPAPDTPAQSGRPGGSFAEQVAGHIRRMGYEVQTDVGRSGFRVDLAVVDPAAPSRYLLGILCDGENYLAGGTARDRNLNQEAVLRSLGWNLHRLWILEWREDPLRELARIREAIEKAASGVREEEPEQLPAAPVRIEREEEPPEETLPVYRVCSLDPVQAAPEEFYSASGDGVICQQLRRVLETEAPVSAEQLCRRVLAAWGIGRLGIRQERRILSLLERVPRITTQSGGREFSWNPGQLPDSYEDFRVPEEGGLRRDPEDIPPEEVANAVRYVLRRQVSLPREDLVREVYRLFGFQRTGSSLAEASVAGLQMALEKGFTVEENGRFICPRD